jgi:hypothetical protein
MCGAGASARGLLRPSTCGLPPRLRTCFPLPARASSPAHAQPPSVGCFCSWRRCTWCTQSTATCRSARGLTAPETTPAGRCPQTAGPLLPAPRPPQLRRPMRPGRRRRTTARRRAPWPARRSGLRRGSRRGGCMARHRRYPKSTPTSTSQVSFPAASPAARCPACLPAASGAARRQPGALRLLLPGWRRCRPPPAAAAHRPLDMGAAAVPLR